MIKSIENFLNWINYIFFPIEKNILKENIPTEIIDTVENIKIDNNPVTASDITPDKIIDFLFNNQVDTNEYTDYYSCGHFSRELAKNAKDNNITMGSVILSNDKRLQGYDNHAMNYIVIGDQIILIEPQSDRLIFLKDCGYHYYKLYPDANQMGSRYRGYKIPDGQIP